jgi:histidinol dehydrogenase
MIPRFAVTGRLGSLDAAGEARLFERGRAADPVVAHAVSDILTDVRQRGDDALRDLAHRFDNVRLDALEVAPQACIDALDALEPALRSALLDAARAIETFHRAQLPVPLVLETRPGVLLGRRAEALARVGVYAPGGRAAYPSSVLMGVIPARVAGVGEVVVCSPPGADGRPPALVLAACALAGADRLFALGGAGAVAALAYGTQSVPRVNRIVGPGNAYVAEAKRQLTGVVAIDCPAGPSEILIVADRSADVDVIAAELIAQAEHDPDAAAVLVTTAGEHVQAVVAACARVLADQPRRDIVQAAFASSGALLVADSLDDALAFATRYAPEHLLLLVQDPRAALERVRSAGTVFLGRASSVAFGDYMTGANHVLPTGGMARAYGGLSTLDFVRFSTWQEVSDDAAAAMSAATALLADAEGLPGHAAAARLRSKAGAHGTVPPVLRAVYADIPLYEPGRVPAEVDLSDNTNLFGVQSSVAERLAGLESAAVTRYPTVYATDLKRAFAKRLRVAPENIVTGCGSDDLIDSAIRAFCEPGDALAYPVPTFGVVHTFARMNAARPIEVPLGPDFALDADALLATGARLLYLCRPNNPTGNAFDREAVARVIREARGLVLIDEAYADFAGDDVLDLVLASDRAVALRTMSKVWGLAGLRVGVAVGPRALVAEIEKSRGPYKVGGVAEALALAALGDSETTARAIASVRANRARLADALGAAGFRTWPSSANFLLVQVPAALGPAREAAAALREHGVQVRPFGGLPHAGECLRVTVGPWPMMESFLVALRTVTARNGTR